MGLKYNTRHPTFRGR